MNGVENKIIWASYLREQLEHVCCGRFAIFLKLSLLVILKTLLVSKVLERNHEKVFVLGVPSPWKPSARAIDWKH